MTYSGATYSEIQCTSVGGTVTGSLTLCKFSGSGVICPAGWVQADNWQKYSLATWGGDMCGRFKSDAPTVFSNVAAHEKLKGSTYVCSSNVDCDYCYGSWRPSGDRNTYNVITNTNSPTNRQEIGCK